MKIYLILEILSFEKHCLSTNFNKMTNIPKTSLSKAEIILYSQLGNIGTKKLAFDISQQKDVLKIPTSLFKSLYLLLNTVFGSVK